MYQASVSYRERVSELSGETCALPKPPSLLELPPCRCVALLSFQFKLGNLVHVAPISARTGKDDERKHNEARGTLFSLDNPLLMLTLLAFFWQLWGCCARPPVSLKDLNLTAIWGQEEWEPAKH